MNDSMKKDRPGKSWTKKPLQRLVTIAGLLLATALGMAQSMSPREYQYKTVDAPGNNLTPSGLITWVNNSGLVVQQYADNDGNYHTAALLTTGWEVIDVPGAIGSGGSNPNSQGEVALSYWGDGIGGIVIWKMGRYTYIPDFWTGYAGNGAQGLNDRGVLAASVTDASGKTLALSGNALGYSVFSGPDSDYTIAFMTSDRGVTVGCFFDAEGLAHGFIQDGPQCVTLDVPDSTGTYATGINSQGDIVGHYSDADWFLRGFVLEKGNLFPFNIPGSRQTLPYCITDNGKIAGVYADQNRTWHGFVAEPVGGK